MSNKMEDDYLIYSFGEDYKSRWYAFLNGDHVVCNLSDYNKLWHQWKKNPTAKVVDEGDYVIYSVFRNGLNLK